MSPAYLVCVMNHKAVNESLRSKQVTCCVRKEPKTKSSSAVQRLYVVYSRDGYSLFYEVGDLNSRSRRR